MVEHGVANADTADRYRSPAPFLGTVADTEMHLPCKQDHVGAKPTGSTILTEGTICADESPKLVLLGEAPRLRATDHSWSKNCVKHVPG